MAHTKSNQDNDASYKLLFSCPELVRDLVMGFIPDEWLHSLDYTTLEQVSGSYITDDLRHRADDVVWRVKAGEEWLYLYILIEFQSKVDPWMAVRMMSYVGLLYQDLIRKKQVLAGRKLPPILPIVLYFTIWIGALVVRQSNDTLALPKIQDMKELKMTLAARFEEWAYQYRQEGQQEGEARGRQEGRQEGEAKMLQRLLVRRFGPLPHRITEKLEKASTAEIEAWGDRVLDAPSLEAIFTRH